MSFLEKIARTFKVARHHEKPFRYMASRALVKTGLCSRLVLRRNGYRLRFHPSNVSVSMWMEGLQYSAWEEGFIRSLLRPGDTFVDVGANIGNLTIAGKLEIKDGKAVAIEAHPRTYAFLASNIALNGLEVDTRNVAVGENAGMLTFSDMHADDCNGVSLVGEGISVPVQTLDDALGALGEIRLLKIDIEGYELMAFRGASDVLRRTKYVYFELWDKLTQRYGYQPAQLLGMLKEAGFTVYQIAEDNHREVLPPGADFSCLRNYLAERS